LRLIPDSGNDDRCMTCIIMLSKMH
jgi:hypothetical protein